jgi:hypothetical protein
MSDRIDLEQYYTVEQAAERLSKNSGKTIDSSYVRTLVKYGKITPKKISSRLNLYPKDQVDDYVVEDRGVRAAKAAIKKAGGPSKRRKKDQKAKEE